MLKMRGMAPGRGIKANLINHNLTQEQVMDGVNFNLRWWIWEVEDVLVEDMFWGGWNVSRIIELAENEVGQQGCCM